MSIFNTTLESIPCQSSNMQQARQCRHLNHNQSEGFGCGVHPVGSNCIYLYGYKKKPCQDVTELILESDFDTHSLEVEDISAQRNSDTYSDTGDAIDTNFTQWTDSTNCWPTGLQQTEAPDINKDSSTECLCALLFGNYTTVGRDKQILSSVLGHTT